LFAGRDVAGEGVQVGEQRPERFEERLD